MTLADWLGKIEHLHPENIKLGLDRIAKVAESLQLTHFDCPVVAIAGTNGKGSCAKFLESILTKSGYKTGVYTSPHLLRFNERIQINASPISDEILCEAFKVIETARKDILLTYFEFTTLAALWVFKHEQLDAIILEVGMGGRLDAVNIVNNDIAIISSIDLDHTDWLGETREKIAYEKAGIFRASKTAICGDPLPPKNLFEHANTLPTVLYQVGRDFTYQIGEKDWYFECSGHTFDHIPLPQLPIENAATSLMAVIKLQAFLSINTPAIYEGIKQARLMGRFQQFLKPYPCILDVAHNPASSNLLAKKIRELSKTGKLLAVVGMLADKDIKNTLAPMLPYIKNWFLGSLSVKRGASASLLASHLQDFTDLNCYTYGCIKEAFKKAASCLHSNDKILVFGSFYTVAETLNILQNEPDEAIS